jgi:hypothetical protein
MEDARLRPGVVIDRWLTSGKPVKSSTQATNEEPLD